MPTARALRIAGSAEADVVRLRAEVEAIRRELELPEEFPAEVLAEVERAAETGERAGMRLDRTDLPLVTVDPPGARDLDQALHLERRGGGYRVYYAIADVAAFVDPGGALDAEVHRRGQTYYGAESSVPLHPHALSADAASLLPGVDRAAVVWTHDLDADGVVTASRAERALVRSRERLTYDEAAARADRGGEDSLGLLARVGPLRMAVQAARGAVVLPMPQQDVVADDEGWHLTYRRMLAVEEWNAQLSLLTGFAAARLMDEAGVGILRTLPTPGHDAIARLRRTADGLGVEWPSGLDHPAFISALDPDDPAQAAMVVASTRVLRGSGYEAFDGEVPEDAAHSALASRYAHVTAPLRRLVDRYGSEIAVAVSTDRAVPEWVREALADLPGTMQRTSAVARGYERRIVDLVEAAVLEKRVGETFDGVVVDADEDGDRGTVVVRDVGIEAPILLGEAGPSLLGQRVRAQLTTASVTDRRVEFTNPD